MGMTIDERIAPLVRVKQYASPKHYETLDAAISTMRKYQKIKEIVSNNELDWGNASVRANALFEVKKVVEDGNDTTNTGSN